MDLAGTFTVNLPRTLSTTLMSRSARPLLNKTAAILLSGRRKATVSRLTLLGMASIRNEPSGTSLEKWPMA